MGATQWLQRDQGVACKTTLVEELFQSGFQGSNPIGQFIIHNYTQPPRRLKGPRANAKSGVQQYRLCKGGLGEHPQEIFRFYML